MRRGDDETTPTDSDPIRRAAEAVAAWCEHCPAAERRTWLLGRADQLHDVADVLEGMAERR